MMKNTILAFCVYIEKVISVAFIIGIAGLIALVTVQEKFLNFADAETNGSLKIDVYLP